MSDAGNGAGNVVPPEWPSWPGVARPAGWFLQPSEPEESATSGPWFVAGEQEQDASWYEEQETPVIGPTAALQGRPGGPGFAVPPGAVPGLSDQRSPWEQSQEVWEDSGVSWERPAEEAGPYAGYPGDQAGYAQAGYDQAGYQQSGYQQSGYEEAGYEDEGEDAEYDGYEDEGYEDAEYVQTEEPGGQGGPAWQAAFRDGAGWPNSNGYHVPPAFGGTALSAPTMADAPPRFTEPSRSYTEPSRQAPPRPTPPRFADQPPAPRAYQQQRGYQQPAPRADREGIYDTWQAQRLRYPDLPPSRVRRVQRRRRPTPLTVAKVGVPVVVIIGVGAVAVMMLTGRTHMMYANRTGSTTPATPAPKQLPAGAGTNANTAMTAFPTYPGRQSSAPELVERISTDGQMQVAVGSADGLPAIWARPVNGTWSLVTAPENRPGTQVLTSVAHGPGGWVAVGNPASGATPHPVVLVSANGRAWQVVDDEHSFSYPGEYVYGAAAGPSGYIVVGKVLYRGRTIAADWWSTDLQHWVRGGNGGLDGMRLGSQMLAAAATPGGFVAVGQHGSKPAAWMAGTAHDWMLMDLPMPAGASSAMLTKVVASGDRLVALGQADTANGMMPFATVSVNGGASWRSVPITTPGGRATTVTALTATGTGFIAAGQSGQSAFYWTSASGSAWSAPKAVGSAITSITGLSSAGTMVTGVGSMGDRPATVAIPVR